MLPSGRRAAAGQDLQFGDPVFANPGGPIPSFQSHNFPSILSTQIDTINRNLRKEQFDFSEFYKRG